MSPASTSLACRSSWPADPMPARCSVTQGKGLTLEAAKASAIMESVEAYHAEHIEHPMLLGTADEMGRRVPVADVAQLPTGESGPYSPQRPQLWVEGRDIAANAPAWVPLDLVHTDFTYSRRLGQGMFDVTSNGLASGNHVLEATSHALCELIERDSTALWSLLDPADRDETRLDLSTVDDDACRTVLDQLEGAGVVAAVWVTTSDVGLPAFMCNIAENPDHAVLPLYAAEGMGCHPRREIALLRALTEAVQSRLTLISGARDYVFRSEYERLRDGTALRLMWNTVMATSGSLRFDDVPTFTNETFDEDVALEVNLLAQQGMGQVVVVDLTKSEFRDPGGGALVPGLECYISASRYQPAARAAARLEQRRQS